ncbi:MAG: hypothetical protein ABR597_04395 [Bacteroidales bacterium]
MRRFFWFSGILIAIVFVLQMQSCRIDDLDPSPDLRLELSVDSLLFDTVFTTVGSSTRYFKVYNRNNSRINISSLELAGGSSSYFRINADGRSGTSISDLEIGPRDSIFVFVEVTVDPVDQNLPLVIADSVVFEVNNNVQDVKLVAWGQDANFIRPNINDTVLGIEYHLITDDAVWTGPKPWVIYGLVLVAPDVTLRIEEGARVHFHNQSALIFLQRSSLQVEGTLEEPIMFQGDRLEPGYSDLPGQWGYIWLTANSRNHSIDNAIIKNATYGIVMDSIGSFTEPTLRIQNTIIKNMDQTGLELRGAWVEASNLLVANCGVHAINMSLGGSYDFRHITVGNYYSLPGSIRQTPSIVFNNYYIDTTNTVQVREFEKAYFGNSIIYGSLQDEILLDLYPDNSIADFRFDHSLVRTSLNQQFEQLFENSIFNSQPGFLDVNQNDYRLREDSPAIGEGDPDIAIDIPYDILGNSRLERVDIGAYQYYEIEDDSE